MVALCSPSLSCPLSHPRLFQQPLFNVTLLTLCFQLGWWTLVEKFSLVDLVTLSLCFVLNSLNNKSWKKCQLFCSHVTYKALEEWQVSFLTSTGTVQKEVARALLGWFQRRSNRQVCVYWLREGQWLGRDGKRGLCLWILMFFPSSPEVLWAFEMEQMLLFNGNSFLIGTSVVLAPNLHTFCSSGDWPLDFQIHEWCFDKESFLS